MKFFSSQHFEQHRSRPLGGGFFGPGRGRGFTTMELIIVLVIIGVLAFVAIPRLDLPSMKVVPVAEQIAAEIRYTQNLAMTRSQEHTFELIGNTISIQGGVPLSDGQTSVTFTGVSISGDNITFTPRFGQTGGASISVSSGSSSVAVVVEGETGYVYIVE